MRHPKHKAKGSFTRVCKLCGVDFVVKGVTQAQAARKNYCCPAHAKKANNTARYMRVKLGAAMPLSSTARVFAMQAAYGLEDDPWMSGRLPESVTANQMFL